MGQRSQGYGTCMIFKSFFYVFIIDILSQFHLYIPFCGTSRTLIEEICMVLRFQSSRPPSSQISRGLLACDEPIGNPGIESMRQQQARVIPVKSLDFGFKQKFNF